MFGPIQLSGVRQGSAGGMMNALGSGPYQGSQQEDMARRQFLENVQMPFQKSLAQMPLDYQQGRFNQIFPFLRQQYANLGNQFATAGGQSGPSPEITVGGVLNPQQIQQQVNAARGMNDQSTEAQIRGMQQRVGGAGLGANSPLAQALTQNFQSGNLATNTGNERDIRLQAAQMNAGHLFKTQMGREQQFAQRQQEDIERRRPIWAQQNQLLAAIAGLA